MRKPHWEVVKPVVEKMRLPTPEATTQVERWERATNALSTYAQSSHAALEQVSSGFGQGWGTPFMAALACFSQGKQRVFKMARHFSHELAKTKLDIPLSLAPHVPEMVCIELPDDMRFQVEGGYVQTAYVFSCNNPDGTRTSGNPSRHYLRRYFIHSPLYREDGSLSPVADSFLFSFFPGIEEQEAALASSLNARLPGIQTDGASAMWSVPANHEYVRFIVKALLYIQSGEPDLRSVRAARPPDTDNAKKLRRWHREHEDECTIDMTLVGYDWEKPRSYGVDSTLVTGHFRWQPYGPGRTQVKLIWIEQHERRYQAAAAEV